ncbi:VOC family protein [Hazenella coriacea]|uniref:Methylmalonyl-CoA epimerase n=1 Tax=Hazenella coriacea TaxID=1179467 RepID=A0A4V2UVI7_9BACL|nr:VOC family protein [Hazenella coriacea]TCS95987.1 methylmalonyl-CoA epimerase [Hazenella coriacea]
MLHHVGLEVKNIERTSQFYHRWFQLNEGKLMELNGEKILFLQVGNTWLEFIEVESPNHQDSIYHLAFKVTDIEQQISIMERAKVPILEPIQSFPNGWKNAFVSGPDGEWIELIQS